jgi:hypothetical protein
MCWRSFATVKPGGGDLVQLRMIPMQIRKLALNRASARDASWLIGTLARASADFGSRLEAAEDGSLLLCWDGGPRRPPWKGDEEARERPFT